MQLILKRKQFATYGVNNNFTSVSYSPGSIQANPGATTISSTGISPRTYRPMGSYANPNSPKAIRPHVALPRPTPSLSYADKYLQKGILSKVPRQSVMESGVKRKGGLDKPLPSARSLRPTTSNPISPAGDGRYFQRDYMGATPNPMTLRQRVQRQAELNETFGVGKKSSPRAVKRLNGYATYLPSSLTPQQHASREMEIREAFSKLPKATQH